MHEFTQELKELALRTALDTLADTEVEMGRFVIDGDDYRLNDEHWAFKGEADPCEVHINRDVLGENIVLYKWSNNALEGPGRVIYAACALLSTDTDVHEVIMRRAYVMGVNMAQQTQYYLRKETQHA